MFNRFAGCRSCKNHFRLTELQVDHRKPKAHGGNAKTTPSQYDAALRGSGVRMAVEKMSKVDNRQTAAMRRGYGRRSLMPLRDYQQDAVNELRAAIARSGSAVYVLPTGGGKTVVAGEIARLAGGQGFPDAVPGAPARAG